MASKKKRSVKRPAPATVTVTAQISAELSKVASAWSAIAAIVNRETSRLVALQDIEIKEEN